MKKTAFRPLTATAPDYPDLPHFERGRRRFLTELSALLGSALLLGAGSSEAGQVPGKKGKKKKKKKDEEDPPRPPRPGGPAHPPSRRDEIDDAPLMALGEAPPKPEKGKGEGKGKKKDKKKPKKRPDHPPHAGVPPQLEAQIDELQD